MLNLKLMIRVGFLSIALLLVWFTYNQGIQAGVDRTVASYSTATDKAVVQYQSRITDLAATHNATIKAIERRYSLESAKQQAQQLELSTRLNIASNQSVEIIESIKYVESECSNIGLDAFSLYKRTRRIVNDPRNPDTS